MRPDRSIFAVLAALSWAIATGGAVAALPDGTEPADDPSRGRDTGIYLGLGLVRAYIDLDLDERAAFNDAGITYDAWGEGLEAIVGYGFGPRLRTEMAIEGLWHDAVPDDADFVRGGMRLTAIVPLLPGATVEPHLLAGAGIMAAVVESDDFDRRTYFAKRGDVGAGVRWRLGRHASWQADYVFSIQDVEREYLDLEEDADDFVWVGGTGRASTFRLRICHDF